MQRQRPPIDVVTGEVTSITITDPGSGYTSAPTVTITGDATATATIENTWTATSPVPIPEGTWNLRVTQRNQAGTESPLVGFNGTLTVDTTVPQAPRFDRIPLSKTETPTITGTGEPGAALEVRATGGGLTDAIISPPVTVDQDGTWLFTSDVTLTDDSAITLTAVQTDAAGHESDSSTATLEVDTTSAFGFLTGVDCLEISGIGYTTAPDRNDQWWFRSKCNR